VLSRDRRKLLALREVAEQVVYVFEMMVLLIPHMCCVASFDTEITETVFRQGGSLEFQ
jgi:hypothetical protein